MSTRSYPSSPVPPVPLAGDGMPVPCADGAERPYLSMDAAASTAPLGQVTTARAEEFIPWYSSVHRDNSRRPRAPSFPPAAGWPQRARSRAV